MKGDLVLYEHLPSSDKKIRSGYIIGTMIIISIIILFWVI